MVIQYQKRKGRLKKTNRRKTVKHVTWLLCNRRKTVKRVTWLLCWFTVSIVCYREGNDPTDQGKITYSQLLEEVCKFANVLKSLGLSSPLWDCLPLLSPSGYLPLLSPPGCLTLPSRALHKHRSLSADWKISVSKPVPNSWHTLARRFIICQHTEM